MAYVVVCLLYNILSRLVLGAHCEAAELRLELQ